MAKKTKEEKAKMWAEFRERCKQDKLPTIKPYNFTSSYLIHYGKYTWNDDELLNLREQLANKSPDSASFILDRLSQCTTKEEINKLLSGEVEAEEKRIQAILKQIDDVDDDVDNDFDNIEGVD